jgi:putative nucleotidyltransferase with HDIG domain
VNERPTRLAIAALVAALAGAVVAAIVLGAGNTWDTWDLPVLATLTGLSIISDLIAIDTRDSRVSISASLMTIVLGAVLLGPAPAAVMGGVTILAGWLKHRYAPHVLLFNLVTYTWFPLITGAVFFEAAAATGSSDGTFSWYLLIIAVFVLALAIDFLMIAIYSAYVDRSSVLEKLRRGMLPVLPSEFAAAALALGFASAYVQVGATAVALLSVLILIFQYTVRALLVSQDRADELELRARQLAGFQVALLSALLRTLDLRDRMTARHSAAVARYSREIAASAGFSADDQELVHSAALLHDIGKFVLPDNILKSGRRRLTDEEWEAIKAHPYEGARIVSQIDGYQPISEIILAHHERIDGTGYPYGLSESEIPELAKIISVADTYDVMTARDTYREPVSSHDAVVELRRVSGSQLDGRYVEVLVAVLDGKDLAYRHGEDADFEAELALDKRIHDYVKATPAVTERLV